MMAASALDGVVFKLIFWPLKVNAAIAGFGVRPTNIDSDLRTEVQALGLEAGLTRHETALILLALVFGVLIGQAGVSDDDQFDLILGTLRHDGKVDFDKPEVIDALYEMGYGVDPHWETDAIMVCRGEFDKEDLDDIDDYAKSPIAQVFARFRWARLKQHVEQSETKSQ